MLLRIRRYFEDPRFRFMFDTYPQAFHILATFLRDTLGIGAASEVELSSEKDVPIGRLPFYDRQRSEEGPADVVILDLSLLAAEVLENVTALIGRLVLEFLQRIGKHGGEGVRGSLPVVLVLEEAQNYIQQTRSGEEESIARVVFDRVAREGRKFGLSLLVASQRPSELSKTVLSQCNSFIVHRLQNPEDLRYFREIVPGIYGPMLDQIPALAPQTALVLGECVPAPALVRVRDARPVPRSRDPRFYRYWVADAAPTINVEGISEQWEGVCKSEENGTEDDRVI
jgi:DNA helicase HerA-like ATPase